MDAAVLADLRAHGRSGGYDVSKRVGARSVHVYPALHRMLEAGVLADEWVPSAKSPKHPPRRMYSVAAAEIEAP